MASQILKRSLTANLAAHNSGWNPNRVKTQIVCTIGPPTNSVEMMCKLLEAGMSVVRMNFSHGDYDYHSSVVRNARKASEVTGLTCAIALDTKGPEIRSRKLKNGGTVTIKAGQKFTFYCDEKYLGDENGVGTSYDNLYKVVKPGMRILMADGLISFTVVEIHEDTKSVECHVDNSGTFGDNKNMNLPDAKVDLPAVTDKDMRDIQFGVENNVDMIFASFIRKPQDVFDILALPGVKENKIQIIAKIENQEGLDNYNEILDVVDGVMVARGDLGTEIPIERVASAQKMMIMKCNQIGKPVITATQMLESMIKNPRPTRAEATDVANAVYDGTDCVMLSGETASGSYPIECVTMMSKICMQAEGDIDYRDLYVKIRAGRLPPESVPESVASSAVKTSWDVQARVIVCLTQSGNTARLVSKYRPSCPIIAVTSDEKVAKQLKISRGVMPLVVDTMEGTSHVVQLARSFARQLGLVKPGDYIILTSGVIEAQTGSTNLMQIIQEQ